MSWLTDGLPAEVQLLMQSCFSGACWEEAGPLPRAACWLLPHHLHNSHAGSLNYDGQSCDEVTHLHLYDVSSLVQQRLKPSFNALTGRGSRFVL